MYFVLSMFAQEHIQFMGIPINGHISAITPRLQAKGLTLKDKSNDDCYVFTGKFAGYDEAEIFVFNTIKSKTVWKVVVYLPEKNEWSSLKSQYERLKESFNTKYEIENEFHFFQSPYYDGDGYEMTALKTGKAHFVTFYKTQNGGVSIGMSEFKQIRISYEDKINVEIQKKEKEAAIMDDI